MSHPVIVAAVMLCVAVPARAQSQPGEPTAAQRRAAAIVPDYAAWLASLNPSQPESIVRARDGLLERYAKAADQQREAAFRQFNAFANKAWSELARSFINSPPARLLREIPVEPDGVTPTGNWIANWDRAFQTVTQSSDARMVRLRTERAADVAALKRYRVAGLRFYPSEGDWYLAQDFAFIAEAATALKLGELAAWTRFKAREDRQLLAEDAGLQVTWEDLRERIARWESFARSHRALPEVATDVESHVRWLAAVYICGLPNTPAYGHGPPGIDHALKTSYGRFLAENRASSYYKVIDGVVGLLARHNDRPTQELVAFLKTELTDPYFKFWIDGLEYRLTRK